MVEVVDERGRAYRIPKSEWASKVLAGAIRDAWNDPDRLYGLIVQALADELDEQVLGAAERLWEIDAGERGAVALAIARMRTGRLDGAEAVLREYVSRHGETGTVLTNLAKVLHARGDVDAAERTVRRGLALDPNQENGLGWWGAIHHERGGPAAFDAAMAEIATEPGAWRPTLHLARAALQRGDVQGALEMYRSVFELAREHGDALMMISGDLGNAGALGEMVELVAPVYDPERHGPLPGLNLARAYLGLGRRADGRALVARLHRLNHPPLAPALAELEQELVDTAPSRKVDGPVSIAGLPLPRPIWMSGFQHPDWLLPPRTGPQTRVVVFALADLTSGREAREEHFTPTGRLTRGVPLYLAEALLHQTTVASTAVMPFVPGGGPVVAGQAWPLESIRRASPSDEPAEIILTGVVMADAAGHAVQLTVFDASSGSELRTLRIGFDPAQPSLPLRVADGVIEALIALGLTQRASDHGVFESPPPEWQDWYMSALEQLLAQVATVNGLTNPASLYNERGFFETYFGLADELPQRAVPKLMAACGVLAGIGYGSPVVDPYRRALRQMVDRETELASPLRRLSPLIYRRLGDEAAAAAALAVLRGIPDERYRAWLARAAEA